MAAPDIHTFDDLFCALGLNRADLRPDDVISIPPAIRDRCSPQMFTQLQVAKEIESVINRTGFTPEECADLRRHLEEIYHQEKNTGAAESLCYAGLRDGAVSANTLRVMMGDEELTREVVERVLVPLYKDSTSASRLRGWDRGRA